ncbi:hemerythrin domain-containing protein [Pseudonocardia sp. KRD291]|uniref:hemerythrin domain-containing protein n=1 Tax=Pseudonocardia sp. KRD291 TaxID=2792007 RepID=UPI001C4A7067|nr:hemerythrin domain-containing protein [Pseudonocardia sp. KRD291]MBW0101328.1 hemerythrin domain-containing protein [Pseudonocardia sp. KRD291]
MTDAVSNSVRAAPDDLVDAHRTACDRLDRAVTDPHVPDRSALMATLIEEIVELTVAKEMHLYPAARRSLPDGDRLVERGIEDHEQLERIVRRIEAAGTAEPAAARDLVCALRRHLEWEDRVLLPRRRT